VFAVEANTGHARDWRRFGASRAPGCFMLRTLVVFGVLSVGALYAFRGALFVLLLYLWIAYFRPEQWVWNPLISQLNISFFTGVAVVIASVFSRKRWRLFDWRIALLGLFVLQGLVSTSFSPHSDYAWHYWLEFARGIITTYLITVLVTDPSEFRLVLLVIGISLGLEAAKQGWIGMMLHPTDVNTNELPMLGDNNGVAVGMLMLIPILTTLASTARFGWERWMHRFLVVGVLYRALSTYSRGGFVACVALALYYAARSPRRIAALAGVALAGAIVFSVLPETYWNRVESIGVSEQTMDTSSASRLHFWRVALAMAAEHPVLGVGHNAYNVAYNEYDDLSGAFGQNRSVHSAWFGVLAELGYPGLMLFIAQLLLALRACSRARRAAGLRPENSELARYAFAIEGAIVAFVVGGSFVPFQYTEMLWHMIGLSIVLNVLAVKALEPALARARVAYQLPFSQRPTTVTS
jgi:putative inorganic carbon (hco3(-)) transporter